MEELVKLEKDMKPKLLRDLGMRYPTEKSSRKYRYGLYECQYCGKEWECVVQDIKTGRTKSCGCQKGGITHGLCNNKFYNTWNNMVKRCNNLKNNRYKNYGGRGITVCEEWLDVANFVAWCDLTHPNIEGLSLDRIDVDGNYEPNNCRWADASTQALNKRIQKNNKSGYVGVIWDKRIRKWCANIKISKKLINLGSFLTKIEAVLARDNYIIENKLPHKLSILNTGI